MQRSHLRERIDNAVLGERELKRRLRTHLIPFHELAVGYDGLSDEDRRKRVPADYDIFLTSRATILAKAAQEVCSGKTLELGQLFNNGI